MNRTRLSYLVAAALIVAIVVLGWFGAISPQLQAASAAQDQIASVDSQNQVLRQTLTSLQAQSKKLPQLTQQLDALRTQIPQTPDVETFVNEIQTLAAANGVSVTALTVPEPVAYPNPSVAAAAAPAPSAAAPGAAAGAATPAPTAAATAPAAAAPVTPTTTAGTSTDLQPSAALKANLYVINLSVTVTGQAQNLVAFLNALQTATRLFLITTVSLDTHSADGGGTEAMTGYVFVATTPQEIAAKSQAATTVPTATPTPSATPSSSPSSTPTPTPTATKK